MKLLEGSDINICQLKSRRWVIKDPSKPGRDEIVEGEAVIGAYPILEVGEESFQYESCTGITSGGSMSGSFFFFPGTLSKPTGPRFEVFVPSFPLIVPDFVH